ncbi:MULTISPECIES: Cof-type HAD-IIB family hydrolase [Priestia]|uniref:Cof-type HAD-IIB family hydrolase n=1 Tax=Priestia TaxID=2800373 RepID=UPI000532CB95|nr:MULTISPECIES: Cof-type HAD-IIB family hydrolase [Priestia]MCQ9282207.1 Cof-type HAD-IIB family hydrolase [Priestia aryabhattai]MCZ8495962.1 Cof-type HAD-IIB family hydrolase [Priestia megaterium]MDW4509720.1 Cof-type HAD-IIB family hydrolase [Priestia megaterium]MED4009989.1 Cof-type HAD-IIB family hydrolase [Priestia aryabhattai]PEC45042.1 HAD family phosphatase [Priestia megaterium]
MQTNEKKEFKLIALDMDGTLLNNQQEISEENRAAIAKAQEQGVHVVLSTGRSLLTCREYAQSLQLSSYLITVNGSEIWDESGQLVERKLIDASHIEKMWNLTQEHKLNFWAVTTDKVWRDEFPEDIASQEWLKFGYDIPDDALREEVLKQIAGISDFEISNSSLTNLEINALGINKAKGIMTVCERLGISMDEVIAMGDSLNDMAMIEAAGCGIAMGNAQEAVKEAADWVTDTNVNNGVAKAISHWVLK